MDQHNMLLKNYKLKQQWDTTIHLLEWPKSKILTPNAGEDVEYKQHSLIAGENAKWYSFFRRELGSFLQN